MGIGLASPSYKEKPIRWAKTLFVLATMLVSLLVVCAPPLLVAVLDVVVPSAMLSAATRAGYLDASSPAGDTQIKGFSYQDSLVDVPIISAVRSLIIIFAYIACDGRGPYLWITTACSFLSVGYVSAKAASLYGRWRLTAAPASDGTVLTEALFAASLALAVAHIVVAYRTSCRERRKMVVYRIDIEAVSAYHSDFPNYHKLGLSK